MAKTNIGDLENLLGEELGDILDRSIPRAKGYSVQVEIYERDRKKRRDASRDSWQPGSGEIRIKFGPPVTAQPSTNPVTTGPGESDLADLHPEAHQDVEHKTFSSLENLIEALRKAEERPGFDFVALTWFRDLFLPAESPNLGNSQSARTELLRNATREGIILTSKVPNPKSPAFPVTAVRLNRQHPDVIAVLGALGTDESDFKPIHINGEDLSDTVLRDRR